MGPVRLVVAVRGRPSQEVPVPRQVRELLGEAVAVRFGVGMRP